MTSLTSALDILSARLEGRSDRPVVVGFSGGGDSTALLLCARAWAERAGRPLLALSVDHGLQADSAAWTAAAGVAARRIGARWRPLVWRGAKPTTGLPAAARFARHALLAEAARAAGACVLLLGHTADDVAESELIRRDTPGHGRLQPWSPSPAWPTGRGVFLLRPLLDLKRAELRTWLTAQGVGWWDDPANADPRFARTRARLELQSRRPAPVAPDVAPAPAPRGSTTHMIEAWGAITVERSALLDATDAAGALGRAILCASGGARPPSHIAVVHILQQLADAEPVTRVLAGARIEATGGEVRLCRELGRFPPASLALELGARQVFDGRFEITVAEPGWTARVAAGLLARLPKCEREALLALPPQVRYGLPVLVSPAGGVHMPEPLGEAPAQLRSLVGQRLHAAFGLIADETQAVQAMFAIEAHSGGAEAVLSYRAETQHLRQAAAARRLAVYPRRMRA